MTFHLQDPGDPGTTYLLEVLLRECKSATGGGGSFAWATRRGINLLIENQHFVDMLDRGGFDLVVGVDAVTDETALQALARLESEFDRLSVSVFLNIYAGSIFHPKVCWFEQEDSGCLVTGSGNLTEAGLSSNWEAFSESKLSLDELADVRKTWSDWKDNYSDDLYSPTDAEVIARAKKNPRIKSGRTTGKKLAKKNLENKKLPANKEVDVKRARGRLESDEDVLVAEIPKGSTRWNQANFDLDNYENYFGAKVGTQRYMFFKHVEPDGSLKPTESRPSVAVKSSNWRFELAAAAGLSYPSNGRPIAVFVRQAARNFVYRLVMPGDAGYSALDAFLSSNWTGPASRIRRVRTSIANLKSVWKSSPLWLVEDPEPQEH